MPSKPSILSRVTPIELITAVQPEYRMLLFWRAARPRAKGAVIAQELASEVVASGGQIPWGELLRCRARYLTDGAVLGSKAFVANCERGPGN